MANQSFKIQKFNSINPAIFRFITRLFVEKVAKTGYGIQFNVEVSLAKSLDPGADRLTVRFFESADLRLGDLNPTVGALLTIYDIAERQLEGLAYRVVDEEAGYFSLNCLDFEFEVQN